MKILRSELTHARLIVLTRKFKRIVLKKKGTADSNIWSEELHTIKLSESMLTGYFAVFKSFHSK